MTMATLLPHAGSLAINLDRLLTERLNALAYTTPTGVHIEDT